MRVLVTTDTARNLNGTEGTLLLMALRTILILMLSGEWESSLLRMIEKHG
jgi:hypothetical protein